MHEHETKLSVLGMCDTVVTSGALLYFLSEDPAYGVMFLLSSVLWTWMVASHYRKQGVYVGIRELVYFYAEIAYWEVASGRTPHDRIHPQHRNGGQCPCCSHEVRPVRSLGEFIAFQLIGLPMIMSTAMLKASGLFFGPLIYIGFAFRASDFVGLSMEARRRYRSSFKQLWLIVAVVGIASFVLKVLLYGVWAHLAAWWNAHPALTFLNPIVYPPAFLPFHLTGVTSATLLLVAVGLVDRAMHRLEDLREAPSAMPTLLRWIRGIARIRLILSVYTWACVLWVTLPWLRAIDFPPVSFELFPR